MTALLLALLVAQVQPAVRRATPAADDPGQVVRSAGTATVAPPVLSDGGYTILPSRPAGDFIDTNNSTTTPLGAGATWNGTSTDVLNYVEISISVMTDKAGTLTVSFSPDGTNWDSTDTRAVAASTSYNVDEVPEGRYYKASFTNTAGTPQTFLRLQSIARPRAKSTTQQQVNDAVVGTDVAALTKGLIVGLTTGGGGGYVPVKVNPSGTLTVDATGSTGLVASVSGAVSVNSFASIALDGGSTVARQTVQLDGGFLPWLTTDVTSITDPSNSSTTPLAGGATFTGAATSLLGYSGASVIVFSDQGSAANGLLLEFSSDGTNWDDASVATYVAGQPVPNAGQIWSTGARAAYFRVVYTNGAVAQGTFRLQTVLRTRNLTGDVEDVSQSLTLNSHAIVTKSVIVGKTTAGGGSYLDVKVNPSGALTVDAGNSTGLAAACTQSGQYVIAGRNNSNVATDVKVSDAGIQYVVPSAIATLAEIELCATNLAGGTTATLNGATTRFTVENEGPNPVTCTLSGAVPVLYTTGFTLAARSATLTVPVEVRAFQLIGPTPVKCIAATAAQTTGACVQIVPAQ